MDRFGNIPQSVSSLLFVSRLRVYAIRHRIVEIAQKADTIQLIFHEDQSAKVDWGDLYEIKGPLLRRITPSRQGQQVVVGIKVKGLKPEESIELVESFLTQFDELKKKKEGEETTDVAN